MVDLSETVAQIQHGRIQHVSNCAPEHWVNPLKSSLVHYLLCKCADSKGEDPFGNPYNATSGIPLTTCADGSFCCGVNWTISALDDGTSDCCSRKGGLFLQDGKVTSAIPSASAARATSATTANPAQSNVPSSSNLAPTATPAPKSTNTGAIVGGVVGGVAAVAILSLAFWYFMIRRKSRNTIQAQSQPLSQVQGPYDMGKQQMWQEPSEAPVYTFRGGELAAEAQRMELDVQRR